MALPGTAGGSARVGSVMASLGAPFLVIILLLMMVIPLPPFMLDFFFTFNITMSLVVIMSAVYVRKPLDFSIFPSVLLVMTLLRLALNVASTRVVLMDGHTGTDAAGKIIAAFGQFVVGGNYSVGIVVFLILVIINFIVVTKGAERISEVTARFTLDAMPGKQMAIDAELNAGMINQDVARSRRKEIASESSFYGAMDGASKFVKGDAIAGILILLINMVGGFAIGMFQRNLDAGTAAEYYILLMIGDGLAAQIPALLLSTAAALIVTRAGDSGEMGSDVSSQLMDNPKVFMVAAAIVGLLGLVPGMPNLLMLGIAAGLGATAYIKFGKAREQLVELTASAAAAQQPALPRELSWEDVVNNEILGLDLGYRLIPLVDDSNEGALLGRMKGLRKKLSQECGFLIPQIHIRDNLMLAPNAYNITLHDIPIATGTIEPGLEMAINPGETRGVLEGIPGKEPAFGLDAVWIRASERDNAQMLGYTVVDPSSVIATHMTQVVKEHMHELLGHDDAQLLLDSLAKSAPRLVENLVPKALPLSTVLKVLQNLLEEGVPIKDLRTIAEALAASAAKSQNPDELTAQVRVAMSRVICQSVAGMSGDISVLTLDPVLEQLLLGLVGGNRGAAPGAIEPGMSGRVLENLQRAAREMEYSNRPPILLTSDELRLWLYRYAKPVVPGIKVLAYREIPSNRTIKVVASISHEAS
jgi:flagellar biosynthesis protein FlhA